MLVAVVLDTSASLRTIAAVMMTHQHLALHLGLDAAAILCWPGLDGLNLKAEALEVQVLREPSASARVHLARPPYAELLGDGCQARDRRVVGVLLAKPEHRRLALRMVSS